MHELVLGTHNAKKRAELVQLLAPFGLEVKSLSDFDGPLDVQEDGTSFAENAAKKATQQALHLHTWVLGEDSGLVVDALDGAPGIYSARFAGEDATDAANNQLLTEKLADVPDDRRGGHYVCHLSLSDPQGAVIIDCEATCGGRLRRQPSGTNGFGYDPLFELPEYHRTFGELGPAVKSVLSHRAKAMRCFLRELEKLPTTGSSVASSRISNGQS